MQATAGPFPRADAAPTQPQGRSGKHCVASRRERSMLEVEMGVVGAKRPLWGHFCTGSASLASYRTPYCAVTNILNFFLPYRLTVWAQAWILYTIFWYCLTGTVVILHPKYIINNQCSNYTNLHRCTLILHTHIHASKCTRTYARTCTHTHARLHTCTYTYTHTITRTNTDTHGQTRTHTTTHTRTHMHTHIRPNGLTEYTKRWRLTSMRPSNLGDTIWTVKCVSPLLPDLPGAVIMAAWPAWDALSSMMTSLQAVGMHGECMYVYVCLCMHVYAW